MYYHHWLFKGLKKIVSIGNLVNSPTSRVGESFFYYEHLREYEGKIRTAQKVAEGIYEAKTPENLPHCHVPLNQSWASGGDAGHPVLLGPLGLATPSINEFTT